MMTDHYLLSTTNAQEWAAEFCRLNPDMDEGLMISWFANAIETGRNFGRKELCPHRKASQYDDLILCNACGANLS